jgi:Protein kinase domain
VAPVVRTSEETTITTPTPHNSSGGSSHDSLGSRCARVRTRSFEYPRSGGTGGPPTPPISGGAATIGVALPQPRTPNPSTRNVNNPSSSLELQPVRSSRHSKSGSVDGATAIRGSGSGYTAGSFPRSSFDTGGTGSPRSGNYGGALDMPFSDWEVLPNEIEIMKRPDGSGADWELGRGAWGRVYKALRGGVQPVAVKELQTGQSGGLQQMSVDAFKQEIAILRACRDANIVQFQGAYLGPERTLLVTEYMEGGDLMANIAAGRINWWRRGRKIAIDVAKGLCFLHARRIVHFDLKSPNILLARDGTAKIGDVGMARILAREYVTGVIGTLSWSAPEMLWGAKCTEKADIYSYGIVLWEICTGERPIRGQLRDVKVPEECPEEVRVLMLECLDTRPSRRPSAVQIVERLKQSATEPPLGLAFKRLSTSGSGDPAAAVRNSGGAGSSDERDRGGPSSIAEGRESSGGRASKNSSGGRRSGGRG